MPSSVSREPAAEPLRILRVIASMNPSKGGPCQGIRNSIPELEKLGISNEVACLDSPEADYLDRDTFAIHALGPAKGPWAFGERLVPWLVENLPRFNAVIIHGLWLYHGYAVLRAFDRLGWNLRNKESRTTGSGPRPALYVMPHGMLDPYFQRDPSRRLKACRNWLYWKLIEGRIINQSDAVLYTCDEELRLAREPFSPYRPRKEINVGYGVAEPPARTEEIESRFHARAQYQLDQGYLLFLSRIHVKKGVDLLIRAYANLVSRASTDLNGHFPDLVIAGPLDSDYARAMQALAAELLPGERGPQILFPGMLLGDEKWGAFHSCDAFILPSHQENFGIAVAEALACGKPVLISNKVNIWREIVSGGGGIEANDDLDGAIELIGKWLSMTAEERHRMGAKAHEVYASRFSSRTAAARLANVLKEGEDHRNSK